MLSESPVSLLRSSLVSVVVELMMRKFQGWQAPGRLWLSRSVYAAFSALLKVRMMLSLGCAKIAHKGCAGVVI